MAIVVHSGSTTTTRQGIAAAAKWNEPAGSLFPRTGGSPSSTRTPTAIPGIGAPAASTTRPRTFTTDGGGASSSSSFGTTVRSPGTASSAAGGAGTGDSTVRL